MKYTILINQLQTMKICERSDVVLDVIDMAIFQFVVDFANSPSCQRDETNEWFWITTKMIIQELPLLRLQWRQIHRHLNKLIAAKLLVRNPKNQQQSISLFKFGENYDGYLFSNPLSEMTTPIVEKDNAPLSEMTTPIVEKDNAPLSEMTSNKTIIGLNHNILNHNKPQACDFENHAAIGGIPPEKNENSDGTYWDDGCQASAGESGKEKKGCAEKKEKNFDFVIGLFNRVMDANGATIPRLQKMTGRRATMLAARLKEYPDTDLEQLFTRIAKSNFLNGGGNKGWIMNFDWLVCPNNFPKILEGNYDNDRQPRKNAQTDTRRFAGEQSIPQRNLDW